MRNNRKSSKKNNKIFIANVESHFNGKRLCFGSWAFTSFLALVVVAVLVVTNNNGFKAVKHAFSKFNITVKYIS